MLNAPVCHRLNELHLKTCAFISDDVTTADRNTCSQHENDFLTLQSLCFSLFPDLFALKTLRLKGLLKVT